MKTFTTQEIRDLYNRFFREEISFTRMVEIMNERVSGAEEKCVENIPVRKFQKGDKVRIKDGVSSKTHKSVSPLFNKSMDVFIGTIMTVSGYNDYDGYVVCNESDWRFNEEWLEPYTDELKEGDLAIFWDEEPCDNVIKFYRENMGEDVRFPHIDSNGGFWRNAIKFESKEQFEKLIKGEV